MSNRKASNFKIFWVRVSNYYSILLFYSYLLFSPRILQICVEEAFLVDIIKIGSSLTAAQVGTITRVCPWQSRHRLWTVCDADLCFEESASRSSPCNNLTVKRQEGVLILLAMTVLLLIIITIIIINHHDNIAGNGHAYNDNNKSMTHFFCQKRIHKGMSKYIIQ